MNPRLFFQQGKLRTFPINTIIGGVAGTISTKALLATKLGIAESEIRRFEIVGSDVNANIKSKYKLGISVFLNNSNLTKYDDKDGLIESIDTDAIRNTSSTYFNFPNSKNAGLNSLGYNSLIQDLELSSCIYYFKAARSCSNLKTLSLPNLVEILATDRTDCFEGLTSLEILNIKKLKVYGISNSGNAGGSSGFNNLKLNCEIQANIALKTVNSGAVHPALNWVKNNRSAIVKFYNDDGSYNSTL